MKYDIQAVVKLSQEVDKYEIYELTGYGLPESPFKKGAVVRTVECSEMEAWIYSEAMNIAKHGPMLKRTSWEQPIYQFRKARVLTENI